MNHSHGQRLFIDRQQLASVRCAADPDAPAARSLEPGQARLRVQSFALTANNITYAAFGQAMKYWQFFPAPEAPWGCLPVWGFAEVMESLAPGLEVGQRVYGYLPAGTHLVVQPTRMSPRGFVDGSAHREALAAVYNQYSHCPTPPDAQQDGLRAVLQPLFMTAFLLDDFLAEQQFFGAKRLLLSSASSKTALATAHCLAQRRATPGHPKVLGLTSPRNLGYVNRLGSYDSALTYADIASLDPQVPTVYLDFAGGASVRSSVHSHFAEQLRFSSAIGGTQWTDLGRSAGLPGPQPTLFFAPGQAALRAAPPPQGMGREELDQRLARAWQFFVSRAGTGPAPWVTINSQQGSAACEAAYLTLLRGQSDPQLGLMLRMS